MLDVETDTFKSEWELNLTLNKNFIRPYGEITPPTPVTQITGLTIDNSTTENLDLDWSNSNIGVLIIRNTSSPTFEPVDGTTYYRDEVVGSDTVAFIGTANSFSDYGLTTSITYHYKCYTYNAGSDSIKYNLTSPETINSIVT